MGNKIANAGLLLKMLREAGYKNTSYAVAEIVDNSIEANAKNIGIYLFEENRVVVRTSQLISRVAIFDDGDGMSEEVLGRCLSFGWGTRLEGATGLGKFGFGLKGASISQARRIEIYSWENPQDIYKTYLDYDEVCDDDTQDLPDPEKTNIPLEYKKLISGESATIPKSGTLVIWKNVDHIDPRTSSTLIEHLNKDMCRIFRHFLDDNDTYGTHRDIRVKVINPSGAVSYDELLKANDPIYLHKPNNLPGHEHEATNIKNDEARIKVIDPDGIEREIHVISSVAKPEIQANTGNSVIGKHYEKNNGISFVRAGRELELNIKGFFANSEPRHRWHGIEIRFEPHLDEYFGVPNNKQGVRKFKNFDESEIAALYQIIQTTEGPEKHAAQMKFDLHKTVSGFIKNNIAAVVSRGASSKRKPGAGGGTGNSTAKKISTKLAQTEPGKHTTSVGVAETKTHDEKLQELIELKQATDTSLTYEMAFQLATDDLANNIQIEEGEWPGTTFLDVSYKGNAAVAKINRNHPFFSEFYDILRRSDDQKGFEALKIFLMAFARAEDVLGPLQGTKEFERIRDQWGHYMKELAELSG